MPQDLIELLKRFNRKERFFLVGEALGNQSLELSRDFRVRLRNAIGLKEQIPKRAFAAMDYHLDWVAASVKALRCKKVDKVLRLHDRGRLDFSNVDEVVKSNQEDVDFFVAFKSQKHHKYYLIFLEAKGYAYWDTKENREQLLSKAKRLKKIFGNRKDEIPGARPYFCLMSHNRPTEDLSSEKWPAWMRGKCGQPTQNWLQMRLPENRLKAIRRTSEKGEQFRIQPTREGLMKGRRLQGHKG